jgi:DNA-binding response OmpR family regulator
MIHVLSEAYSGTVQLPAENAAGARRRRTALIVEDDPSLRKVMSAHVARMDFDVLAASHYAAALVHLVAGPPDIACVDIGLPTESGYELCEYIRGPLGLKSLPIMVTNESGSPEEVAYAELAGADAFLEKPFSMPELGVHIQALLIGAWSRAANVMQAVARRRDDGIDKHAAALRA